MRAPRRHFLALAAGIGMFGASAASGQGAPRRRRFTQRDFDIVPDLARDQSRRLQRAIDTAARAGGELVLAPGRYVASGLTVTAPLAINGTPGLTHIVAGGGDSAMTLQGAPMARLFGLTFDGAGRAGGGPALVVGRGVESLSIDHCRVINSAGSGVDLARCGGRVVASEVANCTAAAIHALDCKGLEISANHVHDIADNGILVWRSQPGDDGAIITGNRIERIAARSGGDGPYGNGINVYRAGNVLVQANQITACAFSAVRDNAGDNVRIIANACRHIDEVAIFVEFAFNGSVVADNLIDEAAMGISITNFNEGGRMAVCANNVVRNLLGPRSNPNSRAIAIAAEADTAITGNVIDNAPEAGIWLGWGPYMRNLNATGNVVRDCGIGIAVSTVAGAGQALIANNMIDKARRGAVRGMDHDRIVTGDLMAGRDKAPANVRLAGNLAS